MWFGLVTDQTGSEAHELARIADYQGHFSPCMPTVGGTPGGGAAALGALPQRMPQNALRRHT